MARQRITWTVLPNGITFVPPSDSTNGSGITGFRLSFSVLVAPRLIDGATLADFPDFALSGPTVNGSADASRTWPDTLAGVKFFLEFGSIPDANGNTPLVLPAIPAATLLGGAPPGPLGPFSASSQLWQALFPAATPVTSFEMPDHSSTKFYSAPVGRVADYLAQTYGQFGTTSPDTLPAYGDLNSGGAFGAFGFEDLAGDRNPRTRADLESTLADALKKNGAVPYDLSTLTSNPADQAALAMLEFHQFHTRGLTALDADDPGNPPTLPSFDFHQMVGLTMGLPAVQRLMGFALDFFAAGDQVIASGVQSTEVRLAATFDAEALEKHFLLQGEENGFPLTQNVFARTLCRVDKGAFQAQTMFPNDSDYEGTQLVLGDPDKFRVVRLDTDSSAIKSLQFAGTVSRSRQAGIPYSGATPDGYAPPALKTAGFGISKNGRAADMVSTVSRQNDLQSTTFDAQGNARLGADGGTVSPLMFLEDLVRGYRFDVFHADIGEWRSLMWREGDYTFLDSEDGGKVHVIEEGCVVETPTTASRKTSDPGDLYLHENLASWKGWSLAVPRVGVPDSSPGVGPNQPGATFFQLDAEFAVPTTVVDASDPTEFLLPRLRFGQHYKVRARAVDHAGNSASPDDAAEDPSVTSPLQPFLRFEPIQAPRVLLGNESGPAEHNLVVVVRSEYLDNYGGSSPGSIDNDASLRFLVPPRGSVSLAEWHHALDSFIGNPPPDPAAFQAAYQTLVTLDAGRLDSHPDAQPDPKQAGSFVYDTPSLQLNFLPDVLAGQLILQGLPHQNGDPNGPTTATMKFHQAAGWPNYHSCQVLLRRVALGSNLPSSWTAATATLTDPGFPNGQPQAIDQLFVNLAQGDLFTSQLNCWIPDLATLQLMAMWEWVEQWAAANGHDPGLVLEKVISGNSWMFTPWRNVTFLHAVRAPLMNPRLEITAGVKQSVGQTFATFAGPVLPTTGATNPLVQMSRKSTSAIDVVGSWKMPIDTGTNSDPVTPVPFTAHAFTATIDRLDGTPDVENLAPYSHEFNDTKYRSVDYQATATTSFMEYFRVPLADSNGDPVGLTFDLSNLGTGITPAVDFEATTVQLTDAATGRRLVQAPLGTGPGDMTVAADYTISPFNLPVNPGSATPPPPQTIVLLASSRWAQDIETGGSHVARMTYVAPSIHTLSDPKADGTTAVVIPNSVRPDAPKVLYAVPIYNRSQKASKATRTGGALHVLPGPALVVDGRSRALGRGVPPHRPHRRYRGARPGRQVHHPVGLRPRVRLAEQPGHVHTRAADPGLLPLKTGDAVGLTLEELEDLGLGSTTVDVAAHAVQFQPPQRPGDAGRWFCDIQLTDHDGSELKSYMPFVRLALARYQRHSITGCELSRVVLADFAQLSPTRSVTVTSGGLGFLKTVTVAGRAPLPAGTTANTLAVPSNTVKAFVEQQEHAAHRCRSRGPQLVEGWSRGDPRRQPQRHQRVEVDRHRLRARDVDSASDHDPRVREHQGRQRRPQQPREQHPAGVHGIHSDQWIHTDRLKYRPFGKSPGAHAPLGSAGDVRRPNGRAQSDRRFAHLHAPGRGGFGHLLRGPRNRQDCAAHRGGPAGRGRGRGRGDGRGRDRLRRKRGEPSRGGPRQPGRPPARRG